jgi:hypothetical protein
MVVGRHHDGLRHRDTRVNGIGLHQDPRHCGLTETDGNLLIMPEGY